MAEFAVSAIGRDQPGIVAAVAGVLAGLDGNVEDSSMTILGGHFALMLLVEVDTTVEPLLASVSTATSDLGLTVAVAEVATEAPRSADPTHVLSVYGSDRPGLLAGVTGALADAGANVTDLTSRLLGEGDEPVYALVVELSTDDEAGVADAVARAAEQLGMDHTLRPLSTETY